MQTHLRFYCSSISQKTNAFRLAVYLENPQEGNRQQDQGFGSERVDWIYLAQERYQLQALVNTVINLSFS
jgi:hypothetical protein